MAFDPVPYFIGGGAQNSVEAMRLVAYAGTAGTEGITSVGDLKVTATAVPGSYVQMGPGSALILNQAPAGQQQTYAVRNPSADSVVVAATGSSGTRVDMVVARIEDPFASTGSQWPTPANVSSGPYVYLRVIQNVPSTAIADNAAASAYLHQTRGWSAIPLAGITIPANTGTITNAMIKDLRKLAQPRSDRQVQSQRGTTTQNLPIASGTPPLEPYWFPQVAYIVPTPDWATQATVVVTVSNLLVTGTILGDIRAEFWKATTGSASGAVIAPGYGGIHHLQSGAAQDRISVTMGGQINIPADFRGLSDNRIRLGASTHDSNGTVTFDGWSNVTVDMEFREVAI